MWHDDSSMRLKSHVSRQLHFAENLHKDSGILVAKISQHMSDFSKVVSHYYSQHQQLLRAWQVYEAQLSSWKRDYEGLLGAIDQTLEPRKRPRSPFPSEPPSKSLRVERPGKAIGRDLNDLLLTDQQFLAPPFPNLRPRPTAATEQRLGQRTRPLSRPSLPPHILAAFKPPQSARPGARECPLPRNPVPRSPVPRPVPSPVPRSPVPRSPVPRSPVPRSPVPRSPVPRSPVPRSPVPRSPSARSSLPKSPSKPPAVFSTSCSPTTHQVTPSDTAVPAPDLGPITTEQGATTEQGVTVVSKVMALLEAAKSTTTRRQSETKQMAEKTPSRRTRSTWSKEHPVVISDSDEHAHTQQPAMPCHRSRKVAMKSQARSKKTIRDQSPQRPVHYPRDKTATASPRSPIGESPLLADSPYLVDRNEFYVDLCPEQELERPESLLSRESTESQGLEPLDVSLEELAHLEPPLLEHLESQGLEYLESKSMSQEPQFRLEERLSPRGLATMSNVDWRGVDDEEEGESPISYVCLPACVSDAVDLPWVEGLLELDQAQVLQKIGLTEVPNRTIVHAILITWLRDENAAKDLALCTLSDLMSVCTRIVEQAYRENDMAAKRIRLPKSIIWSVPALPGGGAFIATNLDKRPERFGVHQCGVMEAYQAACVYSRTRTAECGSGRQSLVKYVTRRKRHSSFYGVFWDYKKQAWFSTWARISDKKKVTNHFYLTSASDDEMCRQNARDDRWRAEGEGECHPRNRQALLTRPDEFLSTCDT